MNSLTSDIRLQRRSALALGAMSLVAAAVLTACGGGGSGSSTATSQSASVPIVFSDAASEDWSLIGVKVLSIALIGNGSAQTIYIAPAPGTAINLAQLDNIGELLAQAPGVPAGNYTGATITLAANPGDVQLTASADPSAGFAEAAGTSVPSNRIQIQGAKGAAGSKTVDLNVKFNAPLVVANGATNALNIEFDLSHPAFLVAHVPATLGGQTVWSVNFNGPVRHLRVDDITRLVLRHSYGSVDSVASDNASITISKELPALPIATPETAVANGQKLTIQVDATNGTLYYDIDAKTVSTIKDFSSVAARLVGKQVRVAARYQSDGTLVATRIYASSTFDSVWLSPEGHVLHVDTVANQIKVIDETGVPRTVNVDASTKFFFRTPQSALSDATPIGTGTAFLSNLVRGFKVHVQLQDPLAATWVAQSVDIETAAFDGKISIPLSSTTAFTYTRGFRTPGNDYSVTLNYIDGASPNGKDSAGNAITGFKYWDFAYPSLVTSGTTAVANFISATSGSVDFGGTVGAVPSFGVSFARWGDPANATGWSAPWAVLLPTPLPRGTVASGLSGNSFTMNVSGGSQAATVGVSTTAGSATLVYQVDRTNGVVTVSPQDISTPSGLTALTSGLSVNAPVKVFGVPQADGTLRAYVLTYFTGDAPK